MMAQHPLDPLSLDEIAKAVKIIKTKSPVSSRAADRIRIVGIDLEEPSREAYRAYNSGAVKSLERLACVEVVDVDNNASVWAGVVSLTNDSVLSWRQIAQGQPAILPDEALAIEIAVKNDPQFIAALKRRGIHDPSLVMVDAGSVGCFGLPYEGKARRLSQALVFVRSSPDDNGYAHPIEGLIPIVDINERKIIHMDDYEAHVPTAPQNSNYAKEFTTKFREDLKPINITQPLGPSFTVKGNQVSWQKWKFRVGFNAREGLLLHTISYDDDGRERPLFHRLSVAEMTVPYGDPRPHHFRKNAFDAGEYGMGRCANSLTLGCDCLGHIHYYDVAMVDSTGKPYVIPHAICMHEEDAGILWKHVDTRTNKAEVRRSRRLVVSMIATVANYEYGYFWYFQQDGGIHFEAKLTGIVNTGSCTPYQATRNNTLVGPQVYAPAHQHFFCMRVDPCVDGFNNSVVEVNTASEPRGPNNPVLNGFYPVETTLPSELQAQRKVNSDTHRFWRIVNTNSKNPATRQPVSYALVPGENVSPFAHPDAPILKRAVYATKHLWVTKYQPEEKYPAGDFPNQHPGGDGLPLWTKADRSITNTDIVVWYVMGKHHIVRIEDYPVMPVATIGFSLLPVGFFQANPALDVPPSTSPSSTSTASMCSSQKAPAEQCSSCTNVSSGGSPSTPSSATRARL